MEKSFPFNSINSDRKYTAEDWANYFRTFVGNGVFLNNANALEVTVGSGLSVQIAAGKGFINGFCYNNSDNMIKSLNVAMASRFDRVVLRLDMIARVIIVDVKTGTPSASPAAPALTRTSDIYELGIADVYIPTGATSLLSSSITDLRSDRNFCGGAFMTIDRIELKSEITNAIATFAESPTRSNISTTDNAGTIFGKIKKWFSDLKGLAFKDKIGVGDIIAGSIRNVDIATDAKITQNKIDGLIEALDDSNPSDYFNNKNITIFGSFVVPKRKILFQSDSGIRVGGVGIEHFTTVFINSESLANKTIEIEFGEKNSIRVAKIKISSEGSGDQHIPYRLTTNGVNLVSYNLIPDVSKYDLKTFSALGQTRSSGGDSSYGWWNCFIYKVTEIIE